jgi:outer membrane protein, heavy metal efflux system
LSAYVEALTAIRELEVTGGLSNLDQQTIRVVQSRVLEGDTAPIELELLRVEFDRLRSRRALIDGRLQAALLKLKTLAGFPLGEPLRLREGIRAPILPQPPGSIDAAIDVALRTRPDLRLARLNEQVAQAGLRLANAQGTPDASVFTRYSQGQSTFDNTPVGPIFDRDKQLSFGISVGIPVFNKNQGEREEAAVAIRQAMRRREFAEQVVRSEVASAYARYEAAHTAVQTFEQGVIARTNANIKTMRSAYELGAFRVTDLLAEQRRLVDSERDFTEALAERYRALADLQQAIGSPVTPQP